MGLLDRWMKKETEKKVAHQSGDLSAVKKIPKASAKKKIEDKDAGVKEEKQKETKKPVVLKGSVSSRILMYPVVTEKSAIMESGNKYIFIVSRDAGKRQIKEAVVEAYGVKPISINTVNVQGKFVRHGRTSGRRSDFKKAIVTLPKGKSITVHEGV